MTTHTNPRRLSQRQTKRIIRTVRDSRITWADVKATFPVTSYNDRRAERQEQRP